ncbi:radical SAM protein [Desulfosarcina sp.]|uniref:radical SAM protein n=1 Tax=Desulfosarcina sp. TaxID=2027861 RepID=UPI003970EC17
MRNDCNFKYKTLFGPVPSRRLGISLGVDLVPHKTCSLDCVYCECGPTTHLSLDRKEYVAVDRVKEELAHYLLRDKAIDHITFSGSGEPTLNAAIGEVIRFLKTDYPQYKVALLTNSTLFDQPAVRRQVKGADVVMASLDAATDAQFRRVNRPHPRIDLKAMIEGLAAFRKIFSGRLLMELFLVDGCNDSAAELSEIKRVLQRIRADGIVLNTLDRPGTEAWVQPLGPDRLKEISDFLEGAEIVRYEPIRTDGVKRQANLKQRLVSTVRRRPCTALDVSRIMGMDVETLQPVLDQMVACNQLVLKQMDRGLFYMAV